MKRGNLNVLPQVMIDDKTISYYQNEARSTCEKYRQAENITLLEWEFRHLKAPSHILDIGCGSGRDMSLLSKRGHKCTGVDASKAMISEAATAYPEIAGVLKEDSLPELRSLVNQQFDVVMALSMLMHLQLQMLDRSLTRLTELCKPEALLLITIPNASRTKPGEMRVPDGRLFTPLNSVDMRKKLESQRMQLIEQFDWPDGLGRPSHSWFGLTFKKMLN